jgi:hypothetical protein
MAKPMGQSKKIASQSLGLSVAEKSCSATVKISAWGGTPSASMGVSGATPAPMCAFNLFDSDSSASDGAAVALVSCQKCPRKSPLLKVVTKPSSAAAMKGMSMCDFRFSFVLELLS